MVELWSARSAIRGLQQLVGTDVANSADLKRWNSESTNGDFSPGCRANK